MSTDLHTLSGAYALDALSAEEAAAFESHVKDCPACQVEIAELRSAAARMGESEAAVPPASLKARVLAAADQVPQQPPKVTSLDAVRRRGWLPKLAVAAAAAVIVAGGAIGISQLAGDDDAPLATGVTQVFSAPDAHTAEVTTDRGVVRVATSTGRNEMAVDATGLDELGAKQVYKVWSIAGGQPSLVVVLDGEVKGASMPLPAPGTQVAITVEPDNDSDQPTTDPIVAVDPATV